MRGRHTEVETEPHEVARGREGHGAWKGWDRFEWKGMAKAEETGVGKSQALRGHVRGWE